MANEAKGAKSQSAEAASQEASLLDQVIGQTRSRNDEQREESRRQISTLVEEVMQGTEDLEGSRDHDQCPHRGDRSAPDQAAQRDPAPAGVPEAGGLVARAALLVHESETEHDAQDPRAQRLEGGPAPRPRARGRVRPERALQEGLRGGVRHLRRRPLRGADRRLRVLARRARTSALLEKISNVAAARPRAVHRRGRARAVQPGQLHRARPRRATWPRSSRASSTPSGSRSGSPRTPATWACACPTS